MKSIKFLLVGIALCVSATSFSQTDTTKKDTTTHKTDTTKKKPTSLTENATTESATTNTQNQQATLSQPATSATTNSAATPATKSDNAAATATTSSATATSDVASTPKANFGRYYIPVLGSYTATTTTTENKSITVTADESNPGKIWIEGLTGSKIYALLKAVPGTYKIPAQKQDDKSVAEGTVVYDENSKQITLCVGCGFNDQAPAVTDGVAAAAPEATPKAKNNHNTVKVKPVPVVSFTGTKSEQGTVSILQ